MTTEHDKDDDAGGDPSTEAIRFLNDDDVTSGEPPLRFASSDDLPHWSSAPSGEMPLSVLDPDATVELDDWNSFSTAPVWREDASTDTGFDHLADLTNEVPIRVGASDPDDFFAEMDEPLIIGSPSMPLEPEPVQAKVTSISSRQRTSPPGTGRRIEPEPSTSTAGTGGRDMPMAILAGVLMAGFALAMFKAGPRYAMVLVVAIMVGATMEFFDVMRRAKYQPATLLGIVSAGLLPVAAYNEGERGMLLVLVLAGFASLIWFLLVDTEARPTVNLAVTLAGIVWIGLFGSYAGLLLAVRSPSTGAASGVGIVIVCIAGTVGHDVLALFAGSVFGRTPLAPRVSPNKTVEGLVFGMVGAIVVPVLLSNWMHPFKDDWKKAAFLGAAIAVVAPLGDLVESLVKRDLGVKDMGTLIPGHGGVFDRFDALIFTLPTAWYLTQVMHFPK